MAAPQPGMAVDVLAPKIAKQFKDFTLKEMQQNMIHIDLSTATYADFGNPYMVVSSTDAAWVSVPAAILNVIPLPVRQILGIVEGVSFRVLQNLFSVDLCCGKARLSRWVHHLGFKSIPIDINIDKRFDLTSLAGLALTTILVLRIVPGGLLMNAPQCS